MSNYTTDVIVTLKEDGYKWHTISEATFVLAPGLGVVTFMLFSSDGSPHTILSLMLITIICAYVHFFAKEKVEKLTSRDVAEISNLVVYPEGAKFMITDRELFSLPADYIHYNQRKYEGTYLFARKIINDHENLEFVNLQGKKETIVSNAQDGFIIKEL